MQQREREREIGKNNAADRQNVNLWSRTMSRSTLSLASASSSPRGKCFRNKASCALGLGVQRNIISMYLIFDIK